MKFSKLSQLFLVSAIGLGVASLLTACQLVTVDYVFVADSAGNTPSSPGQIEVFAVDSQSGALRTGAPTVATGGTQPVSLALTAKLLSPLRGQRRQQQRSALLHRRPWQLAKQDTITLARVSRCRCRDSYKQLPVCGFRLRLAHAYRVSVSSSGTIGAATATETFALNCTSASASYPSDTIVPTSLTVIRQRKQCLYCGIRFLGIQPHRHGHQHCQSRMDLRFRHRLQRRALRSFGKLRQLGCLRRV